MKLRLEVETDNLSTEQLVEIKNKYLGAVGSYILGLTPGIEALKMIIVGFVIFLIPVIGQGITAVVVVLQEGLCDFIRS